MYIGDPYLFTYCQESLSELFNLPGAHILYLQKGTNDGQCLVNSWDLGCISEMFSHRRLLQNHCKK